MADPSPLTPPKQGVVDLLLGVSWVSIYGRLNVTCDFGPMNTLKILNFAVCYNLIHGHLPQFQELCVHARDTTGTVFHKEVIPGTIDHFLAKSAFLLMVKF